MLYKMKQLGYTEFLEVRPARQRWRGCSISATRARAQKLGLPRDAEYKDGQAFLEAVATRKGKVGVWNEANTASHVLARFRKGLLGRVCLDDVADAL